jgi:hypothetical protein
MEQPMPNSTVPAAAIGLPDAPTPNVSHWWETFPGLPVRFRLADDFTGPAGQLIAVALAAQAARRRLEAAQNSPTVRSPRTLATFAAERALQQGGARRG